MEIKGLFRDSPITTECDHPRDSLKLLDIGYTTTYFYYKCLKCGFILNVKEVL